MVQTQQMPPKMTKQLAQIRQVMARTQEYPGVLAEEISDMEVIRCLIGVANDKNTRTTYAWVKRFIPFAKSGDPGRALPFIKNLIPDTSSHMDGVLNLKATLLLNVATNPDASLKDLRSTLIFLRDAVDNMHHPYTVSQRRDIFLGLARHPNADSALLHEVCKSAQSDMRPTHGENLNANQKGSIFLEVSKHENLSDEDRLYLADPKNRFITVSATNKQTSIADNLLRRSGATIRAELANNLMCFYPPMNLSGIDLSL